MALFKLRNAAKAGPEIKDLSRAELDQLRTEIRAYAAEKAADAEDDKIEEIVEKVIISAISLAEIFVDFGVLKAA